MRRNRSFLSLFDNLLGMPCDKKSFVDNGNEKGKGSKLVKKNIMFLLSAILCFIVPNIKKLN